MGKGSEQTFPRRGHVNVQEARGKMLHITRHEGHANQNHHEIPLPTWEDAYNIKKDTITSIDKDVEKLEPSHVASGNIKCCSYFGKESSSFQEG